MVSITDEGEGDFFDLTVPGYENYVANGIVNHNSGKSLSGAHAVRELLFGTKWSTNPRVAFVGRTLDAARKEMFINTFLTIVPPGSIIAWRKQTCELQLALPNGRVATINSFSAETPDALRGPNLHLAWADEIAAWLDGDKGTGTVGTTWSNLNYAVRVGTVDTEGNEWTPRIIATTTPRAVRILHNLEPDDGYNPGLGLHQNPKTVVSSMSTLDNLENLAPGFYEDSIAPYEGTRLYEQEVLGKLLLESVGALWSSELIDAMGRHPAYPLAQGGGLVRTVVGVDPAASTSKGAEHGIVVAGIATDGNCYVLQDASMKGRPSEVCDRIAELAKEWNSVCAVVEANHGGQWLVENIGRSHPNLRVEYVWAKKGKALRAEPVALLSDKGRLLLAGTFPVLTHQMRTYDGTGTSPDRLDAMVYAVMFLMPNESRMGEMVRVVTRRFTRR